MKAPIAVLHVIAGLDADMGGTSRCVPEQCSGVARLRFRMGIIALDRGKPLSPEALRLQGEGIETQYLSPLRAVAALWKTIARYDIVHVDGLWHPFCHLGAWFARLRGKPVIITPHGMLEPWSLGAKRLKKGLGSWLYQRRDLSRATVLQATVLSEAGHFRAWGLRTPIAVIPYSLVMPKLRGQRPKPKVRRLLFLSRVHPKKGVLELVRAVAAQRRLFQTGGWVLTIAGPDEGGHLLAVQSEVERLGLRDLVEFQGAVEGAKKWALYRSADIFVLPTYSENFGLVVAEALACGTPVLTTQGAPWQGLVQHRCGWWPAVGQAPLEKALALALRTPRADLAAMGKRGQAWITKDFSWPAVSKKWGQCYHWLLHRGSAPDFFLGQ
jgi:glycosyltransferase involved in cell wall biosynthesis